MIEASFWHPSLVHPHRRLNLAFPVLHPSTAPPLHPSTSRTLQSSLHIQSKTHPKSSTPSRKFHGVCRPQRANDKPGICRPNRPYLHRIRTSSFIHPVPPTRSCFCILQLHPTWTLCSCLHEVSYSQFRRLRPLESIFLVLRKKSFCVLHRYLAAEAR
jgi:hypothetical protein